MATYKCAQCNGTLIFSDEEGPMAVCTLCRSVNLFNNAKGVRSLSDGESVSYIDNGLRIELMVPQLEFVANYKAGTFNYMGGHLLVSAADIVFRPHSINFGNQSNKHMKIADVVSMVQSNGLFGLMKLLTITDNKGRSMILVNWTRDEVVAAIEERKGKLRR